MTEAKLKQRGFTLVELLIVIVVIAILAAISIVAYNGIQQRSRDSAALQTASSLAKKIEAFNASKGNYPVFNTAGTITSQLGTVTESTLSGDVTIQPVAASITAANGTTTVQVRLCGATAPANGDTSTGFQVYVFDYSAGSGVKLANSGGTTTACSTSTSGS
jgi:prepilin-type N-terminal cleavage/methylation domain-containing protein